MNVMTRNDILILDFLLKVEYEMYPSIADNCKYEMDQNEFSLAFGKLIKYNFIQWIKINDIEKVYVKISDKGKSELNNIENQKRIEHKKNEFQNLKSQLELKNLAIQNESLLYSNSLRSKENEIRELTIKNLKLQNREFKLKVLFSIAGFFLAYLLNNISKILIFLEIDISKWLK